MMCRSSLALTLVFALPLLAQTAPDTSTPKAALKSFTESIRAADTPKVRACLHATTPLEEKMADATAEVATSLARLRLTAVEKFGEAGGTTFQSSVPTEEDVKRIDAASEKIEGDSATVDVTGNPAGPAQMRMVKVAGAWKISIAHMVKGQSASQLESDLGRMATTTRLVNETTEEIKAGKHANDKAAYEALKAKMVAAFPAQVPAKK